MKNVIIFQDFIRGTYGKHWDTEELFNYFKAQIDNSIFLGWDPSDIVILTNLPFSYKNITIIPSKFICTYNKYFNKLLGIWELLHEGLITEDFWFHDFDDWQLKPFSFPKFEGYVGACKYINFTQWNTGSLFIKSQSLPFWQLCRDFIEVNDNHPSLLQVGDENIFNLLYHRNYEELKNFIVEIPYDFNIGMTGFDDRLARASDVKVIAFKPELNTINYIQSKGISLTSLISIFEKHNLITK